MIYNGSVRCKDERSAHREVLMIKNVNSVAFLQISDKLQYHFNRLAGIRRIGGDRDFGFLSQ